MKSSLRNYGFFAIAVIAFTFAFSTVTLANDENGKSAHMTELTFIGNIENQPVFQLNLNTSEEDEFIVTFRDEAGNVLYTDKFKGSNLVKKFLLKPEGVDIDASLNVVVKSKNHNTSDVYTISRNHNYVEETVINKIK